MISYKITTKTRDDFIDVGHRFGQALLNCPRDYPWMIHLGAAHKSGKSLLALAIDEVFNPDLYPKGLTETVSADIMLDPFFHARELSVAFRNFYNFDGGSHQHLVDAFVMSNLLSNVLIGANLHAASSDFNLKAMGNLPTCIDLNIDVHKSLGKFTRKMVITTNDVQLAEIAQSLAKDYPAHPIMASAKNALNRLLPAPNQV